MAPAGFDDDPPERPERPPDDSSLFDDLFVAGAQYREETAAERAARAEAERREQRRQQQQTKRQARKQRLTSRLGGRRRILAFALFGAVVLVIWRLTSGDDASEEARGADRPPDGFRVTYAVPADVEPDPGAIDVIRDEIAISSGWLESQTGGRTVRFVEDGGQVAVEQRRLSITAVELADRSDAAGLVRDEFPDGDGDTDFIRIVFTPVQFREQVRCGESSTERFIVVWIGSCGPAPSATSRAFGDGTTATIAHEIVHALGAVQPCAPHYGRNGHVVDDRTDLMYDGSDPVPDADLVLDPGHDDYYEHGDDQCTDIADHPAWLR
ncbi:MAG: hypothetical protein ACRDZ7_04455 [Acidimicrobiia bacterium]